MSLSFTVRKDIGFGVGHLGKRFFIGRIKQDKVYKVSGLVLGVTSQGPVWSVTATG